VGDLVISCPPGSNNFSEVSTDIPAVEAAVVTQTPATPTAARVEAAQALAFTGSNDTMPFAALGALSVAGGAVLLVLARRRRGTAS
jgi:LPXTG-motif cell wall-anchored protein